MYYYGVKRTKVCLLHFRREDSQNYLNRRIPERWFCNFQVNLLCPFSYQGKVNILENKWIHRRDLTILIIVHFCASNVYNEAKCFHSFHHPVFKSLSSAIKVAIFGKLLLVYLKTLCQVAKIDHTQGQIQCLNTWTLFPCQNLFPSSYFVSLQQFLC